jgi:hypothetical protein
LHVNLVEEVPVPIISTGTWRDAYAPPRRPWTLAHRGGPADGVTLALEAAQPPQARWYASAQARRRRVVTLDRYALYRAEAPGLIVYLYCGTDERAGPAPGRKESPAWSW